MFVSQRPTLAPLSSAEKSLVAPLIIGIPLNFYVFFLPYNFIADETGYIHQVLTAVEGEPRGGNIRSFVYPFLLSTSFPHTRPLLRRQREDVSDGGHQ